MINSTGNITCSCGLVLINLCVNKLFVQQEEIRGLISKLDSELMRENKQSNSALSRVEKYRDVRREMERKLDTQYQRKM